MFVLVRFKWELQSVSCYSNVSSTFQVDNLSSGLSAAEEMALMKKLGALEVENKELKKGESWVAVLVEGRASLIALCFSH